jgi:hypothetical protein
VDTENLSQHSDQPQKDKCRTECYRGTQHGCEEESPPHIQSVKPNSASRDEYDDREAVKARFEVRRQTDPASGLRDCWGVSSPT